MSKKRLIIGSRRSALARTQSNIVRHMLLQAWDNLAVEIELIDTRGDLNRRDPLPALGGKGLFTAELEAALHAGRIDLAVHSLKDLPILQTEQTDEEPGLSVIAIPERAAVGDMLISPQADSIENLPPGAVVGTSSLRRAAQILALRPDVQIKDIRGNVETRLRKVTDPTYGYDATILARAGLERLGYTDLDYAHSIPLQAMVPAPGQGALAVQGREADAEVNRYLQILDHPPTRAAVTAERAFLAGLGGGCSLPVAALGRVSAGRLTLQGLVARPDGRRLIRVEGEEQIELGPTLGRQLAEQALARGAEALLGR